MSEPGAVIVFALVSLVLGIVVGAAVEEGIERDAAIKVGAGEYYLDTKYQRQFRYLPPNTVKKAEHE